MRKAAEEGRKKEEASEAKKAAAEEKKRKRRAKRKRRQKRKKAARETAARQAGVVKDGPEGVPDEDNNGSSSDGPRSDAGSATAEDENLAFLLELPFASGAALQATRVNHQRQVLATRSQMDGPAPASSSSTASRHRRGSGRAESSADAQARAQEDAGTSTSDANVSHQAIGSGGVVTQADRNLAADVLLHRMTQITHTLDNASPMATMARAESIRELIQRAQEYRDGHQDVTVLMTVGGATSDELLFAANNLRQRQREQQHQLQPPSPVPRPTDPALLGALAQIAASIDILGARLGQCHDRSRQTQDTRSQSSDATVRPSAPEDDPFWSRTSDNTRNTILGHVPNHETRSAGHHRNFLGLTPYGVDDWRLGSQPMTAPIPQARAFDRRLTHPSLTPIGFERASRNMAGFMGGTLASINELAAQDGQLHVNRTRSRDAERLASTTDRAQGLGIEVVPTPQLNLADQTGQPAAQRLDDGQENPRSFQLGQTEHVLRQTEQLVASLSDADAATERAEEADQEEGRTVYGGGDEHVGPLNESIQEARSEDADEEEIKAEEQRQEDAKQEGGCDGE